jgi:hypothetical protein
LALVEAQLAHQFIDEHIRQTIAVKVTKGKLGGIHARRKAV